jgi:hypothetical protein
MQQYTATVAYNYILQHLTSQQPGCKFYRNKTEKAQFVWRKI